MMLADDYFSDGPTEGWPLFTFDCISWRVVAVTPWSWRSSTYDETFAYNSQLMYTPRNYWVVP